MSDRKPVEVDEIGAQEFPNIEIEEFRNKWNELANVMGVDPRLMRSNDPISAYIPRHVPELTVDAIENFLEKNGVTDGAVSLDTPIKEIIKAALRKRT